MSAAYQGAATVLLTGASRGIGLATLEILLKRGVNVVAMQRSETPELTKLASTYPGVLMIVQGDVSKDVDNKNAVDVAVQSFGRLDALILNSGTLSPLGTTASLKGKLDEYKNLFDVNFFSLVSIVQHALPYLKETEGKELKDTDIAGKIIMVSSGAATGGTAGWGAYNASKAALNSLVRTLGNEEPTIVSVAVRPGVVDTAMQKAIRETGGEHMTAKDLSKFTGLHETGNLVPPHKPGGVLAGLALSGVKSLSGTFVNWEDEEMKQYLLD